jgi:hypothetical protein
MTSPFLPGCWKKQPLPAPGMVDRLIAIHGITRLATRNISVNSTSLFSHNDSDVTFPIRAENKKDFFTFFCFANCRNRRLKEKVLFDAVVKKVPIVRFTSICDTFMLLLKKVFFRIDAQEECLIICVACVITKTSPNHLILPVITYTNLFVFYYM